MFPIQLLLAFGIPHVAAFPASKQQPLGQEIESQISSQGLTGRFLHITDFHPDPLYVAGTSEGNACHRGRGAVGYFGQAGASCDAPISLVNETFRWIERNLKDKIDFVVWTGDSARHDNDDDIPRTIEEVIQQNEMIAGKFLNVFKNNEQSIRTPSIPIIPSIGNNDFMPHNIFNNGPNRWTRDLLNVWEKFIPEEQRHTFVEGGWFTSEVIPNKLAIISMNTMYFYESNSAVDGCEAKSDPGYEHMEWMRVQLKLLRERQMKAILIGHVPPARSGSKKGWYESCWQKYALWKHQYRDVVIGSLYGHMNMDHFIIQDSEQVNIVDSKEMNSSILSAQSSGNVSEQSKTGYLNSMRKEWSQMPSPPPEMTDVYSTDWFQDEIVFDNEDMDIQDVETSKRKQREFLNNIGGPWAERYSVSLVPPSIVPTYFPTLRVIEYNTTGLDETPTWADVTFHDTSSGLTPSDEDEDEKSSESDQPSSRDADGKKKKHRKNKKKKKPEFTVPEPPSSTAPPGPAYSNQALSWLGLTQYYANLTRINNEWQEMPAKNSSDSIDSNKDKFFEIEYETKNDGIYDMKDLTVRSYFKLATRIANKTSARSEASSATIPDQDLEAARRKPRSNQLWRAFLGRAFTGLLDVDELDDV